MKIFIDGDGCPVKNEVLRVANTYHILVTIVVDYNHRISMDGVEVITVDQGFDSADMAIISRLKKGDLVITNDIGLASLVLGKKGYVMDANGREIKDLNIDRLLFERHMHKEIRLKKGRHKNQTKRRKEADVLFENSLNGLLNRLV